MSYKSLLSPDSKNEVFVYYKDSGILKCSNSKGPLQSYKLHPHIVDPQLKISTTSSSFGFKKSKSSNHSLVNLLNAKASWKSIVLKNLVN